VAYRFVTVPFEWVWLPPKTTEEPFPVPMVCGCAFTMKKNLFRKFDDYGGFLYSEVGGAGAEEDAGIRIWRIGEKVLIEPRSVFLHYFKCLTGRTCWDEHIARGWHQSRVAAAYINIFNPILYSYIESFCRKDFGDSIWDENMKWAKQRWGWVREKLRPLAGKINEYNFFLTT
jgi:hypothetical protein